MSDFLNLTNKDEVMDCLEKVFRITDYGYSVVKQDKPAITKIINKGWVIAQLVLSATHEDCYGDVADQFRYEVLRELVAEGYLTYN